MSASWRDFRLRQLTLQKPLVSQKVWSDRCTCRRLRTQMGSQAIRSVFSTNRARSCHRLHCGQWESAWMRSSEAISSCTIRSPSTMSSSASPSRLPSLELRSLNRHPCAGLKQYSLAVSKHEGEDGKKVTALFLVTADHWGNDPEQEVS